MPESLLTALWTKVVEVENLLWRRLVTYKGVNWRKISCVGKKRGMSSRKGGIKKKLQWVKKNAMPMFYVKLRGRGGADICLERGLAGKEKQEPRGHVWGAH